MPKIQVFTDTRGQLKFIDSKETQQFLSFNNKNVFRGIHCSPYEKCITCIRGMATDFVIDLKSVPPKVNIIELKENDKIYVPPNHGHAFLAHQDDTILLYQLEGRYDPKLEKNYHYLDPWINLSFSVDLNENIPRDCIVSQKALFYKPGI